MNTTHNIQHQLLIDDSIISAFSHGGSNYFNFSTIWNNMSTDAHSFTETFMVLSLTSVNIHLNVTDMFGLYFNGTGITLYGSLTAGCSTNYSDFVDMVSYTITIDEMPYFLKHNDTESASIVNQTALRQPPSEKFHTLELDYFNPCQSEALGSIEVIIDYALVGLGPDTVIEASSREDYAFTGLMAMADDEFITYSEGDWTTSSATGTDRPVSMETRKKGASLLFLFYGSFIMLCGAAFNDWVISITLDQDTAFNVSNQDFDSHSETIFRSDNYTLIQPPTPDAPHSINITVLDFPFGSEEEHNPEEPYWQISAILYRPTFTTLSQGDSMFERWRSELSPLSESSHNQTRSHRTPVIAGGVVGGSLGLTVIIGVVLWLRRKQTRSGPRLENMMGRDLTTQVYRPTSENPWSSEDATTFTNRDFNPYMETTGQHDRICTGDAILNLLTHQNTPTQSDTMTPYRKFYHQTSPNLAIQDPTAAVPYMKHYQLDPVVLPPREAQEDEGTSPTSLEPPSSSVHSRSRQGSMDHTEERPISMRNMPHIVPYSSDTQESGYEPWHQHTAGDDTASREGGAVELENPATMRRVLRMVELVRARVDALEQPPPYVAAQASAETSGGSELEAGVTVGQVEGP